jgi:hypothetical protein
MSVALHVEIDARLDAVARESERQRRSSTTRIRALN